MLDLYELEEGQSVYIIYRDPQTPAVSSIQQATVTRDPGGTEQLALFLFDDYHLLEEDHAIFTSYEEAETIYDQFIF
ncbi:transcriptional regulator [Alkalihalobacillus oceani]|uniref:transcriptional regulator SplA domain-containing protein n=1 Tax=Halalkalibacter oceani TaxID=1653776 RepID=UPI002040BF7A|nr:transcriptional regulator SplA domain-containing protein [Halalkalibacter oceani]MCM3760460.1 transcriptional regulator [Halalkalibacter oceani]